MPSLLVGLWLTLGSIQPAHAQTCTYYLSPTGNDSNNGTSSSTPWKTLQKAFNTATTAGQTVCLGGGGYASTVTSGFSQVENTSGTAGNPITFTNVNGQVAIIAGSTKINGSYITFTGTPQSAGTCGAANQCGLVFEGTQDYATPTISVLTEGNAGSVIFDHVEIRYGTFHAGLYQEGCNNQITGSYVHDNGFMDRVHDSGIDWQPPIVNGSPASCSNGGLIANNLVEHNYATGIQLFYLDDYSTASCTYPTNVTVTENTSVKNGSYGAGVWGNNNVFVNNILDNNGDPTSKLQGAFYTGINTVVDYNVTYDTADSTRTDWYAPAPPPGSPSACTQKSITNKKIADPAFVSPCTLDWHLTSTSPAIGWSNSSYVQPVDKDSRTRTNPSDAGCYIH